MISCTILNRIAREMQIQNFSAGKQLKNGDKPVLYMIENGEVDIISENMGIETIHRGDFFGEEGILYGTQPLFEAVVRKKCKVFMIKGDVFSDIPIIQLKLQETLEKRVRQLESRFVFDWREEYSVGFKEMDEQHEALFEKVKNLYSLYRNQEKKVPLEERVAELIDYVKFHLKQEEELLQKSGYHEYGTQREEHNKLRRSMDEFMKKDLKKIDAEGLLYFFNNAKAWLLRHTILEDMKYKSLFIKNSTL
jgi:hemerythrin-like metal-binding protein